ncbi:unnamed protein product, partial [Coregonus sp. 'balchen']
MLDLYEASVHIVAGIKGMLIANRRLDNQVKTYITYNKGHDWRLLQAPATDLAGNDIHCVLPFCSLHLQLQTFENPYLSGSISTKASAPGIKGKLGLSGGTITLECSSHLMQVTTGNRISFDEGRQWTRHSFSLVPLFVDGMLVEAGTENQIMTFFGHFSHRSEWQIIKIDYKSIFNRNVQKETIRRGTFTTRSCSQGQNYLNSTGYRKIVSNNCIKGVKDMYTPRKQMCPNRTPKGLSLSTREGKLTADLGTNVTFLVHLDEGDSMRTNIQLDFGDGTAVSYSNLSWIEEGIRHVYKTAGIFRAVEHVQLLAQFVVIKNKEVNLTAVPVISLDGSISYTFTSEGMNTVTVQVFSANTIVQDTKMIADQDFPEDQLLVAVFPGVPTAAELFLLPHKNQSEGRKKSEEELKQISEILACALDQNLVEFELKPGERVIVYITQLTWPETQQFSHADAPISSIPGFSSVSHLQIQE